MQQAAALKRRLHNERLWQAAMVATLCCRVSGACARQECTWRRVRKGCDVCGVLVHHSLGSPGAHPAANAKHMPPAIDALEHNLSKSSNKTVKSLVLPHIINPRFWVSTARAAGR